MAIYLIISLCFIRTVLSQASFTLVLDTTHSMGSEVDIIKSNIHTALEGVRNSEYILIPFGDPDVGPPLVFETYNDFIDHLDLVEVGGGKECPERSLSAIELALEKSKPYSNIFLFTDANAQAQERDKLDSISNICRDRRSRVFIFLSGQCSSSEINSFYYDVANVCSGSIYYFELLNLRKAFSFIKVIMSSQWTAANAQEVSSNSMFGVKQFAFTVDSYTSDIMVGVSGENPEVQVINSIGESPAFEVVMRTKHSLVIRIKEPTHGDYSLEVQCQGPPTVSVFTHKELRFKYGFSPKKPRSLKETSKRPIPGTTSNILIVLPEQNLELTNIEVQIIRTGETIPLKFDAVDIEHGLFVVKHLFEPGKSFRLLSAAKDNTNSQIVIGATEIIETQQQGMVTEWVSPVIYIIDDEINLLDFGLNATFACKIESFPKPEVWWEDEDSERLPSDNFLLEIPSTYISYVSIDNATRNNSITCKAKNAVGEAESTIDVFVNRTLVFEVLQFPSDITIEYGDEGKLYCEVNAYPEAEIKWYHNGTEVDGGRRHEINNDEHSLLIKDMDIEDAGEYECDIKNGVESTSYTAAVYITGLDAPAVKINNTDVVLKPGDRTQQECTIQKGKPLPTISWKFKHDNEFEYSDLPYGVYIDGNIMKIPSVQTFHGGVYVCEASNILGVDSQEVLVKVQYPPKIKNRNESLVVKQGDLVILPCEVDAVPDAEVHWTLYQDDVIIAFDDRHYTDYMHSHRFTAQSNDSGMYHCMAQNSMGTSTRTVNVNVWVAPYIEPLLYKNITQRIGSTVYLDCYINFGNPVPSTKWEFIASNTNISVLTVQHATGKLDYTLKNVTKKNEGYYRCIAENEVGVDSVQVYVKVV